MGSVDAVLPGGDPTPGLGVGMDGGLSLPAFADPHVHLDKALTANVVANPAGDLAGAIEAWLAFRGSQTIDQIRARARRAAIGFLLNGATALRVHVDTGPDIGLAAVRAISELRSELAGLLDIQIVGCAFLPLTGVGGSEVRAIAAEALAAGADLLGGAPYLDEDPASAYEELIAIALDAGKGLDLHVDESTDQAVFTLPQLIERVAGFPHPVAVDHIVSLAAQPTSVQAEVAERLAAAQVAAVVLPATNLYLQGRGPGTPAVRGLTAIRELLAAGVTVAAGADNVRDPFNPTGRCDPLETASLLVTAGHLLPSEALDAVSRSARAVMGLTQDAARPDLVRLPGESPADVIAAAPAARVVLRSDQIVARTSVETWVAELG